MELRRVSFETGKLLKRLGFNYLTKDFWEIGSHNEGDNEYFNGISYNWNFNENHISCPTVALAIKWLREAKNLFIVIFPDKMANTEYTNDTLTFRYVVDRNTDYPYSLNREIGRSHGEISICTSWEEAELTALSKTLELLDLKAKS